MSLAKNSEKFLEYLEKFVDDRSTLTLEEAIQEPERTAIVSVDVINGFLYEGPLASPRVAPIGKAIAQLMDAAWERGVRDILLLQDAHEADSLEFEAYGEHVIKGTRQAEAVDEIKSLPFYDQLTTYYKDSIHPALNTDFDAWLDERDQIDTFIVVGDVTDLCVYQLATYLKLRANAYHKERRVIVPEN
jgi:nicotinamidase-related amidase